MFDSASGVDERYNWSKFNIADESSSEIEFLLRVD